MTKTDMFVIELAVGFVEAIAKLPAWPDNEGLDDAFESACDLLTDTFNGLPFPDEKADEGDGGDDADDEDEDDDDADDEDPVQAGLAEFARQADGLTIDDAENLDPITPEAAAALAESMRDFSGEIV